MNKTKLYPRKFLYVSIILVTAISLFIIFSQNTSADMKDSDTIYVDDDGSPAGDGSLQNPYSGIQDAVDNSSDGDIIRIFEGAYPENIVVGKNLTITGNGTSETVLDGNGTGDVLTLSAPGTVVSNLSLTGNRSDETGLNIVTRNISVNNVRVTECYFGVYSDEADDFYLSNSVIEGNQQGVIVENSENNILLSNSFIRNNLTGISIYDSSELNILSNVFNGTNITTGVLFQNSHGNNVTENLFSNLSTGVKLQESHNNRIEKNQVFESKAGVRLEDSNGNFVHKNQLADNQEGGILISSGKTNEISENICSQNQYGIFAAGGSNTNDIIHNTCNNGTIGLFIKTSENNQILNNTFRLNDYGLKIERTSQTIISENLIVKNNQGIRSHDTLAVIVKNNTIAGSCDPGINLTDSTDMTVIHNLIENGNHTAFYLAHSDNIMIFQNTIRENLNGIMFDNNSLVNVHRNNIIESWEYGVKALGNDTFINATENYWGASSGPYHPQKNANGEGDNISDWVKFEPWYGHYMVWSIITKLTPGYILNSGTVELDGTGHSLNTTITKYRWSSSIDGELYNGTQSRVEISNLSNGTHRIEFSAQDSQGVWSIPDIGILTVNGKPVIRNLTFPDWIKEGEGIVLSANISEDREIQRYRWVSSYEGLLYNGSDAVRPWEGISHGERVISLQVQDNMGEWSEIKKKNFSVYRLPQAEITEITPENPLTEDEIQFSGNSTGDNDIEKFYWYSDVDGELYNGQQNEFNATGLSRGIHNITLRTTDSRGLISKNVTMKIFVNDRPKCFIQSLLPSPGVLKQKIEFISNASDNGSILNYRWLSSLDGELYKGGNPVFSSTALSYGEHLVTLQVKDNNGVWSAPATKILEITMRPSAIIKNIQPNPASEMDEIRFSAGGSDDGKLMQFSWSSDINGTFYNGTKENITISNLSAGTHTISLEVKDNSGIWSKNITEILVINENTQPKITISSHVKGEQVKGTIEVSGVVEDENDTVEMWYRTSNVSNWVELNVTSDKWSFDLDTTEFKDGKITLQLRAYDGKTYAAIKELELTVINSEKPHQPNSSDYEEEDYGTQIIFLSAVLILLVAGGLIFVFLGKSGKGKTEDGWIKEKDRKLRK